MAINSQLSTLLNLIAYAVLEDSAEPRSYASITWSSRDLMVTPFAPAQYAPKINNGLEARSNVVQFQKSWYPRSQLTEIYQHRVEPQNFWKKGAPY